MSERIHSVEFSRITTPGADAIRECQRVVESEWGQCLRDIVIDSDDDAKHVVVECKASTLAGNRAAAITDGN